MKRIISKIFVLICSIAFIVLGIFTLVSAGNEKKNNTAEALATVVSYHSEESEEDDEGYVVYVTNYYPVFSYTVDGKEYSEQYNVGSRERPYEVGSEVAIMYNPASPENFNVKGDNSVSIFGWVFIGVGILILFFFRVPKSRNRLFCII